MGSCPLTKNVFCCSKNVPKKKSNFDLDLLKDQRECIYESDNYDNKKYSNLVSRLKVSKFKMRTKTYKRSLNDNELDDSDHVIQLRPKIKNKKKKKKKNHSNSNKIYYKRRL